MKFPLLAKTASIGAIVVLLTLVLVRIDWLVSERKFHQAQAAQSVAASLAGEQTLLGPLLQRNCTESWDVTVKDEKTSYEKTESRSFSLTEPPTTLAVIATTRTEPRYRGLFKVNSYSGPVTVDASWAALDALTPRPQQKGSRLECSPVYAIYSVTDVRGIRKASVQVNKAELGLQGGTQHAQMPQGFHVVLADSLVAATAPLLTIRVQLDIAGTQRLAVVPAAGQTDVSLRSDWRHPSFGGRFLPVSRQITAKGFEAAWSANAVSSTSAAQVRSGGVACTERMADAHAEGYEAATQRGHNNRGTPCLDTFDVSFFDPVNPYSLTDRATKYALLFIALTFAAVALTEVLGERRVHPVQYTLVGLALALFYLLLLSLSEHITFAAAYAVASAACVLLLAYYGAHMLGRARSGLVFGAGMAALYGMLWVLLQAEQTALAIGSVLLFVVLAVVMVITRKMDWYALFGRMAKGGTHV
jgi:inner membrane protein